MNKIRERVGFKLVRKLKLPLLCNGHCRNRSVGTHIIEIACAYLSGALFEVVWSILHVKSCMRGEGSGVCLVGPLRSLWAGCVFVRVQNMNG